ncbi:hypothetical protein PINS_up008046 [Pythium insidiosum]|nr:hypothetical protein PINS_up008046 [Pythium insidiosum]
MPDDREQFYEAPQPSEVVESLNYHAYPGVAVGLDNSLAMDATIDNLEAKLRHWHVRRQRWKAFEQSLFDFHSSFAEAIALGTLDDDERKQMEARLRLMTRQNDAYRMQWQASKSEIQSLILQLHQLRTAASA